MPDSPERLTYKFQRLREAIRDAIETGELKRKLPGERDLARRFSVNAKTISKALNDLTTEGLLVRRVGRGTFVAGQECPDRMMGTSRRYLWLASAELPRAYVDSLFQKAKTRVQAQGHGVSLQIIKPDRRGELPGRCIGISTLKELAGIVVFSSSPSRAFLADLSRRHLPVVLCNSRSQSIKTDAVVADFALGLFELTEHLAQLGHEHIRLMVDKHLMWASAWGQRGYQTALGRYQLEPLPVTICRPDEVEARLEDVAEFSALVCIGDALAVAVKERLVQQGRNVPGGVSLAAMGQPGQFLIQQQAITGYEVQVDHVLDWAIQTLFELAPGDRPRDAIVPGSFHDRGSTRSRAHKPTPAKDRHVSL